MGVFRRWRRARGPLLQTTKELQLELEISRPAELDRNHHKGGRSFYFFDFDDNVAFLTTPIFLFHKRTGVEIEISSRTLGEHGPRVGKSGLYADYEFRNEPKEGSFRCFRDQDLSWLERRLGRQQMFVQDLALALSRPEVEWKGPSWNCFYHAVFNGRPLALITARGHHPETLKAGIRLWVKEGHLPKEPNYLGVYPVNHPTIKQELGLEAEASVPRLKQRALRAAVEKAYLVYGPNPHHRFGMSDDDPQNIAWMMEEMRRLKAESPNVSFFMIQTFGERVVKHEIFKDRVEDQPLESGVQMTLFDPPES